MAISPAYRHGRACPGHPRLRSARKTWMPGPWPGMTENVASNRVHLAQGRDLLGRIPELLEHRDGVLAERRRRRDKLARRARQRHALTDKRELAAFHRLRHLQVL